MSINSRNEKSYIANQFNRIGSLKFFSINNNDGDLLPNEILLEKRFGESTNRADIKVFLSRTKRSFKISNEKSVRQLKADDLQTFFQAFSKIYPSYPLSSHTTPQLTQILGLNFSIAKSWLRNSKFIQCSKTLVIHSFGDLFYAFPITRLGPFERQTKVQELFDEIQEPKCVEFIEQTIPSSYFKNRSFVSKPVATFFSGKHPSNDQLILPELLSDMFNEDEENIVLQKFDLEKKIKSLYNEYLSRPYNSVFVAPSLIHKYGLFSRMKFKKYDIVIEYVGELIRNAVADKREKQYRLQGFGDCYMFRIDKDFVIDATFKGNEARYLNHSCNPNCASITLEIDGYKKIVIYAKEPIEETEELTYDYQFEAEAEKLLCTCGAKNCQGRMN